MKPEGKFVKYEPKFKFNPGEMVQRTRILQGWSQNELAERSGLPQSTISGIESGRIKLGVERAKTLARALRIHPSVLVFPGWDIEKESAA